jgi:Iodothyronine deiodinase
MPRAVVFTESSGDGCLDVALLPIRHRGDKAVTKIIHWPLERRLRILADLLVVVAIVALPIALFLVLPRVDRQNHSMSVVAAIPSSQSAEGSIVMPAKLRTPREALTLMKRHRDAAHELLTPPAFGEQRPDSLKVGDPAPDFRLEDPLGIHEVRLSSLYAQKPVVLVFASFTWLPFRRQSGDLERLYQAYADRAEFLLVYIREAHPGSMVNTVAGGERMLMKIDQTETLQERAVRARQCVDTLNLTLPVVVDGEDSRIGHAYAGWPDRLYVVETGGKIAYQGAPGPAGFRLGEVERWLSENTGKKKGPSKVVELNGPAGPTAEVDSWKWGPADSGCEAEAGAANGAEHNLLDG